MHGLLPEPGRGRLSQREKNLRWCQSHPEAKQAQNRRNLVKHAPRRLIQTTIRHARSRGIECTLTYEDFDRLLEPMVCSKTGIVLSFEYETAPDPLKRPRRPWVPSFDRIDSSKGYAPGNVQLVCWAYNMAKSHWDEETVCTMARGLVSWAG